MRNLFRLRLLLLGLVVATGWSCTETLVGVVDVATVDIEPETATVFVDADVTLQARAKDDQGNTLTGRELDWISEDPQVAIVSDQGLVHGVAEGEADITAVVEGIRSTARVTVLERPIITVERDSAVFSFVRGETPAPVSIAIGNAGGATLSGLNVTTEYDGAAAGWLVASLSATEAPAALSLTPVVDQLQPGAYRATVSVRAPDASNTPVTIGVRLELLAASPASMTIAGGSGQIAAAGTAVQTPLTVLVTDERGIGVRGVTVRFAVRSGGGSLAGDGVVTTDSDGIATAPPWTLGTSAGANTVTATADELPGDSVVFTATAIPGSASQLTITTQPSASSASGSVFARQPIIQLRDGGGNPVRVAGVAVTAALASGAGDLMGTPTVSTDAAGVAAFTDLAIVGSIGEKRLVFTAAGLSSATSAPVAITAGAGTRLGIPVQPSPTAQSGVPFARQPAVQLLDGGGNPVAQAGVVITAGIGSGGGMLGGTVTAATSSEGLARFSDLRISGTVGPRTLEFTASGISRAATGTIMVGVGPASAAHSSALVNGGTAGTATHITITVQDDGDNPVTGEAAQLAVSVSGANTATPHVVETGSGSYRASYIPTSSGTDQIAITLGTIPISGSPYSSTVLSSAVSDIHSSISISPADSVVANGSDAAAVTVVLRDSLDNPIGGLAGSIKVGLNGSATAGPVAETSTTGAYMFNLTSTAANLVGIVLTVGGTALSDRPTVEFVPGPVAVAVSDVGASPATNVIADGLAASTVTITLADAFNNPVTGLTDTDFGVVITGSASRSGITESGTAGTYTFTVTNNVAETVTVSVTARGVPLTQQPTIQFVAGGVSSSLSTATPNKTSMTADGADASTITLVLVDGNSNPITGLASSDFGIVVSGSGSAGTVTETATAGTYTFDVTNSVAEQVTVTITAAGVQLAAQPVLDFVVGSVSAASAISASPATNVTADGVTGSTVTVILVDGSGNAITGLASGAFSIGLSGSAAATTIAETATPGTYTFTITNTVAETVTVTVTASLVQLTTQPTIDFVAGPVDPNNSSVTASPGQTTTGD